MAYSTLPLLSMGWGSPPTPAHFPEHYLILLLPTPLPAKAPPSNFRKRSPSQHLGLAWESTLPGCLPAPHKGGQDYNTCVFGSKGALLNYGCKKEQPVQPPRVSQQQRMYNKEWLALTCKTIFFLRDAAWTLYTSWKEGSWMERRPPWTPEPQRHSRCGEQGWFMTLAFTQKPL